MNYEDVTFCEHGLVINLRRSKTDQEGEGRMIGLPWGTHSNTCPVKALRCWLNSASISSGALFRSVNRHGRISQTGLNKDSIGTIIKRAALRAGMRTEGLAGHSLRCGHVTQSVLNGVPEFIIMRQTGHRSLATLRKYIRRGELFRQNSASGLGL